MSDNKVKLETENLKDILGGLNVVSFGDDQYLTKYYDTAGTTRYYFDDVNKVAQFYAANVDNSIADIGAREDKVVAQMLEAGLVRLEP